MAIASGSTGLEAAVVMSEDQARTGLDAVRDFAGEGVPVHLVDARGVVRDTIHP